MELSLLTLHRMCVLGPELMLPKEDFLHNAMGAGYDHAIFAPAPSINSSYGLSIDIRGGKPFVFKGEALRKLDFVLKTCPYICDVRCYVPIYFSAIARKKKCPDIKLDRVITIEMRDAPGRYHLHAILTRNLGASKAEKLAALGITSERIDLSVFCPVVYENALRLYQGLRLSNVGSLRIPACAIATRLHRTSQTPLRARLERFLKRFGQDAHLREQFECKACDLNDLFRWTYAAIVLGELPVDLDQRIGPYEPIRLLPAGRWRRHVSKS